MSVPSSYIVEIIGKGGSVIKAMRDVLGTNVDIPDNKRDGADNGPVTLRIAGPKDKVKDTKKTINEILQFYHSPATHPGIVHHEVEVAEAKLGLFIGARGANIRHMEGDSGARVHLPRTGSVNRNVVIVGNRQAVAKAVAHAETIIKNLNAPPPTAQAAGDQSNEMAQWGEDDIEEPHADWMDDYIYQR